MAKRRCRRSRSGLSGIVRTCVRYHRGSRNKPMRCAQFAPATGCPPYRGQRKSFSECTTRGRVRYVSSSPMCRS